jgi:ribosomal protein S18 acetylase RimI-like enzyme
VKSIREAIPADAPAIAKVHVDTWRSTYTGVVSGEFLLGLSYERSERGWLAALEGSPRKQYIYVANEGTESIFGFVAAGAIREEVAPFDSEIYALYVLKEHQGMGYGRKLMAVAAQRLKDEGYSSMMLWVLAENATREFYEHLGGLQIAEQEIEIGGTSLPELGYGWKDLDFLINGG